MSDNKNKYFVVNQIKVVKALNKTDAERFARQARSRQVLMSDVAVDRIAATDAHSLVASAS
jgi:hypothetical protein